MAYEVKKAGAISNGWLVTEVETGKKFAVFCHQDANTAEDAILLVEETKATQTGD